MADPIATEPTPAPAPAPAVAPVVEPAPTPAAVEPPPAEPNWRDSLPDDLKNNETLARFDSAEAAHRSHLEVRSKVGADTISIPGKDATDEQRSEFWLKLGRPEAAEGYEPPGDLPEGVALSEDDLKAIYPKFHELGLTKQQAAGILRIHAERELADATTMAEASNTERTKALADLKAEIGEAYGEHVERARNAAATLKIQDWLVTEGLADEPVLIKALAEVGKWLAEDQIRGRGARSFTPSIEEAKVKIEAIRADPAKMKAFNDPNDPARKGIADELNRLYHVAYPGQVTVGGSKVVVDAP